MDSQGSGLTVPGRGQVSFVLTCGSKQPGGTDITWAQADGKRPRHPAGCTEGHRSDDGVVLSFLRGGRIFLLGPYRRAAVLRAERLPDHAPASGSAFGRRVQDRPRAAVLLYQAGAAH